MRLSVPDMGRHQGWIAKKTTTALSFDGRGLALSLRPLSQSGLRRLNEICLEFFWRIDAFLDHQGVHNCHRRFKAFIATQKLNGLLVCHGGFSSGPDYSTRRVDK